MIASDTKWSPLVRVMIYRIFIAKPLPEPMMIPFIEAFMRHQACMSYDLMCRH